MAFNELIMPKIVKQMGSPKYSWPNGNNVVTRNWTLHMIDTAIAMQTWRIFWKKKKSPKWTLLHDTAAMNQIDRKWL